MSSSPHPIFVLAACGAGICAVLVVAVFKVRRVGLKLLLALLGLLALTPCWLVLLAMHPEWTDERYRSYQSFYEGLRLGMTRAEVMDWEHRVYPEQGPRLRPRIMIEDDTSLTFFMDPEKSAEPNCESIILAFKEGKLKSKTYSPD